ncbi:MAG: UDP-N-acetylmuramoyl-tripeptide--D-alanyl-D-alanine ligase [Candidatus Zixiibacteriota bacterium]
MRFDQAARVSGGTLQTTALADQTFTGVSIDSRTLRPGELFFAIRGERVDGHDFISQAVDKGAAGIVLESRYAGNRSLARTVAIIAVHNSHEAMIRLASEYRQSCRAEIVGITGSNGKTTTKEITHALLCAVESDVYKSQGNLNNTFGTPLALFGMPRETRVAVMEMGISTPGEMTRLAQVVRPDVVVITNVSATHLEFLGSIEGVAKAKLELVTSSRPDVPVIINADDPVLLPAALKIRKDIITFGLSPTASFRPDSVSTNTDGGTRIAVEGHQFLMPLFGQHQVYNLLAGYAVCRTMGYDFDDMDTTVIKFDTAPLRGQHVVLNGVTFIADCYNANPESVKLGLQSFAQVLSRGRRLIVLGDMLELGSDSEQLHREIGRLLADQTIDLALLVGPMSVHTRDEAASHGVPRELLKHFTNAAACAEALTGLLKADDLVYLKGSRGIGLEAILESWQKQGGMQ